MLQTDGTDLQYEDGRLRYGAAQGADCPPAAALASSD